MLLNQRSILYYRIPLNPLPDPVNWADKRLILTDGTYGQVIKNNGNDREQDTDLKTDLGIVKGIIGEEEKHSEQTQHKQYG